MFSIICINFQTNVLKNILKYWFTYNCRIKGINNWMAISRKHLKYIIGCLNKICIFLGRTAIWLIINCLSGFYESTEGNGFLKFIYWLLSIKTVYCLLKSLHIIFIWFNNFNFCTVFQFWYLPMLTRVRFVEKCTFCNYYVKPCKWTIIKLINSSH